MADKNDRRRSRKPVRSRRRPVRKSAAKNTAADQVVVDDPGFDAAPFGDTSIPLTGARDTSVKKSAKKARQKNKGRKSSSQAASRPRRGRRSEYARKRSAPNPERRRALRRRWVALLSVLTIAGVAYVVFFTSLLGVRSVEVLGTQRISADEIRTVAAAPTGRAMALVDIDAVSNRVASIRGVASVDVSRSWPSTLEISVIERVAIGFFERSDGIHLVDGDGVDFATVKEKPTGLPQLKLANIAENDPNTRAVTAVLANVPLQLRAQVSGAGAATPSSVELNLVDGKTVRWGNAENSPRKAKVLTALLTRDAKTYDVSSPELPTTS